jgi:hypothetical protein
MISGTTVEVQLDLLKISEYSWIYSKYLNIRNETSSLSNSSACYSSDDPNELIMHAKYFFGSILL